MLLVNQNVYSNINFKTNTSTVKSAKTDNFCLHCLHTNWNFSTFLFSMALGYYNIRSDRSLASSWNHQGRACQSNRLHCMHLLSLLEQHKLKSDVKRSLTTHDGCRNRSASDEILCSVDRDKPQLVNARATFCKRFYADDLFRGLGRTKHLTQDASEG